MQRFRRIPIEGVADQVKPEWFQPGFELGFVLRDFEKIVINPAGRTVHIQVSGKPDRVAGLNDWIFQNDNGNLSVLDPRYFDREYEAVAPLGHLEGETVAVFADGAVRDGGVDVGLSGNYTVPGNPKPGQSDYVGEPDDAPEPQQDSSE